MINWLRRILCYTWIKLSPEEGSEEPDYSLVKEGDLVTTKTKKACLGHGPG